MRFTRVLRGDPIGAGDRTDEREGIQPWRTLFTPVYPAHRSCDTARGAETRARFKQYKCRANSSLVLTTDSWPRPTSDPETLWGLIDKKSFGTVPCRPSTLSLMTGSPNPVRRSR